MRHYEIVLLIHPDQSEQVPAMLDRYKDMVIAEKGQVHRVEDWGRRRLAYMVNDVHKAHYVMLNLECSLESLRDLEQNFKFNDSIIRSLVIRRDQAVTEESALAKAKAEEAREEARIDAEKRAARDRASAEDKAKAEEKVEEQAEDQPQEAAKAVDADNDEGQDDAQDTKPADESKPEPQPETA